MEEKINNYNLLSSLYKDYVLNNLQNNKIRGFTLFSNNDNNFKNSINNISSINNDNSVIIDNSNKNGNNTFNIHDDFYKIFISILDEIKNNSKSKISSLLEDFDNSYNNYIDKISKYIEKINNNFLKLNMIKKDKVILNYATKTLFKKLDFLYHICSSIVTNIEHNFELILH